MMEVGTEALSATMGLSNSTNDMSSTTTGFTYAASAVPTHGSDVAVDAISSLMRPTVHATALKSNMGGFLDTAKNGRDCFRGELILDDAELAGVFQMLGSAVNEWRFERVVPSRSIPGTKNSFKMYRTTNSSLPLQTSAPLFLDGMKCTVSAYPQESKDAITDTTENEDRVNMNGSRSTHVREEGFKDSEDFVGGTLSNDIAFIDSDMGPKCSHEADTKPSLPMATVDPLAGPIDRSEVVSANQASSDVAPGSLQCTTIAPPPAAWAELFRDVVVELCEHPASQPITVSLAPNDADYKALAMHTATLEPTSLLHVLEKLDAVAYNHCHEAFQDVYAVLVRAFRYYDPGCMEWMKVQEAALLFSQLVRQHPPLVAYGASIPLVEEVKADVFREDSGDYRKNEGHTVSLDAKRLTDNACVDQTLQELLAKGREKKRKKYPHNYVPQTTAPSIGGGRPSKDVRGGIVNGRVTRGGYKHRGKSEANEGKASQRMLPNMDIQDRNIDAPIQDQERSEFQSLLLQLKQDQHYDLFTEFQHKAVWRTLEGGEVELDDRGTSPRVFRGMVAWCRHRLMAAVLPSQSPYYESGLKEHGSYKGGRNAMGLDSHYKASNDSSNSSSASSSADSESDSD